MLLVVVCGSIALLTISILWIVSAGSYHAIIARMAELVFIDTSESGSLTNIAVAIVRIVVLLFLVVITYKIARRGIKKYRRRQAMLIAREYSL